MSDRVPFRQSDVTRAIKAARAGGLSIAEVVVDREGRIRIKVGEPVDEKDLEPESEGYL